MNTREIVYESNSTQHRGYFATCDSQKRPTVIVAHAWGGRDQFAMTTAERLTELGFHAFALDMYGEGRTGDNKEENSALMQPLMEDRDLLKERMLAAVNCVRNQTAVNRNKVAAIGFCFGGLCVLDLARSGADVRGVVSFHGLLGAPASTKVIRAKVLALHGYDDPMVTPDDVKAFASEMTTAKADWQMHMYGHTMHAFTNPSANDPSFGTVYDETADLRSWLAMANFLDEVFA